MNGVKPLPWLLLLITAISACWFLVHTAMLATQLGFPSWLLDKAIIAFLMFASLAAIVKVILLRRME